ncbi:hypothetical protein TVAG_390610 [Trichomonas vaginalis G3]|uniref:Uncharacterized protein n=1 Tax=Trichomonas vaginalis (strain ATCC PRA-98 / G3) TaxID=412133 RepID=A2ESW5_TRIV3|nr:armadillo (ARM) repeat-containing protein family [Trichomonas vaginalis G3]EAY04291.1 hypothetical protein TVAG_390610 [Trichomonas vaginalis G3]KAI5549384.1 armadillo (ARM) repeat-containing protein family [Trichomonas vaginalis G3]|eukprot:XP_001316514.1 hypothetical protein [Trichomonas vaginalis G3]
MDSDCDDNLDHQKLSDNEEPEIDISSELKSHVTMIFEANSDTIYNALESFTEYIALNNDTSFIYLKGDFYSFLHNILRNSQDNIRLQQIIVDLIYLLAKSSKIVAVNFIEYDFHILLQQLFDNHEIREDLTLKTLYKLMENSKIVSDWYNHSYLEDALNFVENLDISLQENFAEPFYIYINSKYFEKLPIYLAKKLQEICTKISNVSKSTLVFNYILQIFSNLINKDPESVRDSPLTILNFYNLFGSNRYLNDSILSIFISASEVCNDFNIYYINNEISLLRDIQTVTSENEQTLFLIFTLYYNILNWERSRKGNRVFAKFLLANETRDGNISIDASKNVFIHKINTFYQKGYQLLKISIFDLISQMIVILDPISALDFADSTEFRNKFSEFIRSGIRDSCYRALYALIKLLSYADQENSPYKEILENFLAMNDIPNFCHEILSENEEGPHVELAKCILYRDEL